MQPHDHDCCRHEHPSHESELMRLNRIAGQVEGIKKMVLERRYCVDILTQLRAARSALKAVEANIVETHLHACVQEVMRSGDETAQKQKIDEITEIFRKSE